MDKHTPILVIGAGSIGERHIGNLLLLGYTNIYVWRTRNLPLRTIDAGRIHIITTEAEVLRIPFTCAIICTPTSMHAAQTLFCLQQGMHVLVEKPLSHTIDQLDQIATEASTRDLIVQVAYMMRYHPHLRTVQSIITERSMGALLHIETHWGSYMPDWHPWEDHTQSYAAKKSLGGGVALTLSHDLDVANWLAGAAVVRSKKTYQYPAHLNIDAEGIADFTILYANQVGAHVHMNYVEQPARREYRFIFEEGSVILDYFNATLITATEETITTDIIEDFDRNQLFIAELEDFIERIDTGTAHGAYSAEQINASIQIIKMCL